MRIVLVSESFYPAVDGTTTTLKAVADRLVDLGHAVEVVAPAPGLERYRGCPVRRVSPLAAPGAQVREALVAAAPDVVVTVGAHGPGSLGRKGLKHARRLGVRAVAVQTAPVGERTGGQWRSKVAERADRVLVTAGWMAGALAEHDVVADVWLPGVDTAAYSPALRDPWLHRSWSRARSRAEPLVVVGWVGSLHRRHGTRRLAELAGLPGTRLVVVGEGPERAWLRSRLPGAVMTGELSPGDLAVAVATLDVLVHPGERETCCHALREAAASGTPAVAPRRGGAAEVVRSLETGLLHDPDEPRDLVRAVATLAGDRHRALMGAHARGLAEARTWRDAVDELLLEHLRDLPAESRPAPTPPIR